MSVNNMKFKTIKSDIDILSIYDEINKNISVRQEMGVYEHYDLSKMTHLYLQDVSGLDESYDLHLKTIKRSWAIDINDFEIPLRKKGVLGFFEKTIKKIIWKLLKFYTFRLFSQLREYNLQVSNAIQSMDKSFDQRLNKINSQINSFNNE